MKRFSALTTAAILSLTLCPPPAPARQSAPGAAARRGRPARPRLPVEEVVIDGNRRLTDEEILRLLRTRPGNAFSDVTVRRDLQALLDLGRLDKTQTRVATETGLRGGVRVIFHIVELPVIRDIEFRGLKSITEAEAGAAVRRESGFQREAPYDAARVEAAKHAVLRLLAARGRAGASVEVIAERLSPVSVVLRFVVKEGRRGAGGGRWF